MCQETNAVLTIVSLRINSRLTNLFPCLVCNSAAAPGAAGDGRGTITAGLRRTWTGRVDKTGDGGGGSGGAPRRRQPPGEVGLVARLLGASRGPPPPCVEDVASTFFEVKGRSREAHAAVGNVGGRTPGGGGEHRGNNRYNVADGLRSVKKADGTRRTDHGGESGGGGGGGTSAKTAGPWRPGVPAISPGLGAAGEGAEADVGGGRRGA